jgi:hypothetical protein
MDGTPREIFAKRELADAALTPPPVTAFSAVLGKTLLSVDELVLCTLMNGAPG